MDFIKKTSSRVLAGILQSFRYDRVFFLALLVTMLVAYSLQVSRLGFYWDDWQAIFLSRLGRPIDYWNFYLSDRPFSAWIYILSVPLLGMSPLPWQIYTLLLRFLSVLGFYWAFTGLWPQRTWQVRWMALLLAVFPGFLQQPISVAYSQHFMTYALFTLSLAGMVWGQRQPRYFWVLTPLALLGCLVHAFTMEYFLGLELLRPVFLWILVHRQDEKKRQTVLKVLKLWTPYLIILTSFMIWRIFIFPGLLSGPDRNSLDLLTQLAAAPFSTALGIIETAWQNFVYLTLLVWANVIPDSINLQSRAVLFSWVIGLGTAALLAWGLSKSFDGISAGEEEIPDSFISEAPLLGTLGIFFGCIPVWVIDAQINVGKWSDRFLLAPMFGAAILLVWMMEWLSSKPKRKSIFLALILGFSIASQIQIANTYQKGWQLTRDYFWQLYWRVPALKPGTAILGTQLPLNYMAEYQIGFALNTLYDQNPRPSDMAYWFVDTGRRRGTERIPDFKEKLPIHYSTRDVVFNSTTSQGLVVDYSTGHGCVHVLSSADMYAPGETTDVDQLVLISHLDQIETDPVKASLPPRNIFGNELPHNWCYFYEKADLGRQMKDWKQVVSLDQQASQAGLSTNVGIELAPFIEGYAHLGQWDTAYQYTLKAQKLTDGLNRYLCSTWQILKEDTPDTAKRETVLAALSQPLECTWH